MLTKFTEPKLRTCSWCEAGPTTAAPGFIALVLQTSDSGRKCVVALAWPADWKVLRYAPPPLHRRILLQFFDPGARAGQGGKAGFFNDKLHKEEAVQCAGITWLSLKVRNLVVGCAPGEK